MTAELKRYFESPESMARLQACLQTKNEDEIRRFIAGVMLTVKNNDKLAACSAPSIFMACIESILWGLPVDSRGLVYLIPYGKDCKVQVSYKGLIAKVREYDSSAEIQAAIIFEGDDFGYSKKGFDLEFYHTPAKENIWRKDYNNAIGAYAALHYVRNNQNLGIIETMGIDEINLIKSKTKTGGGVWAEWFGEMAKKAVIKRLLKTPYAGVALIDKIIAADNEIFEQSKPEPRLIENILEGEILTPDDFLSNDDL